MALDTNATKLQNLINPQVIADLFNKKLTNDIRFTPLCTVDGTLAGRPGSTITIPVYTYIGAAGDVAEGADIGIAQLTQTTTTATIKKAGKGVQITDEAVLSGFGDPVGEAVSQLALSVADNLDNEVLGVLNTDIPAPMTYTTSGAYATADDIADALVKFGEDIEGEKVILVSPKQYAALRKADDWCPASEIAAQMLIRGSVGMIHGCQVVVSNRLAASNAAYIVKPGALALYLKRDTMIESDRNIVNKSTIMTVDKHYVVYLYDASKAIKITTNPLNFVIDTNIGATTALGNKVIGDLQTGIAIGNDNGVTGTLKYVTGFNLYTGDEQNGNFLGLHATAATGASITCELVGSTLHPGRVVTLDADGIAIARVENKETQVVRLTVTKDSITYARDIDLKNLKVLTA